MPIPDRLLHILDEPLRTTQCRACGRLIQWATVVTAKGSHKLPFKPDPFTFRYERVGHVRFRVVGGDQIHQCPNRKPGPRLVPRGTKRRLF
jgi:hypothetical protein